MARRLRGTGRARDGPRPARLHLAPRSRGPSGSASLRRRLVGHRRPHRARSPPPPQPRRRHAHHRPPRTPREHAGRSARPAPVPAVDPTVHRATERRNIRAHYDLGNEFFERMLDDTMMYSCAHLRTAGATLADASRAKARPDLPGAAARTRRPRPRDRHRVGRLRPARRRALRLSCHHDHDLGRAVRVRAPSASRDAGLADLVTCATTTTATSTEPSTSSSRSR